MPKKYIARNDVDHMRLVALLLTAAAALINSVQVLYPFGLDPNRWGMQDGQFGGFIVIMCGVFGVLAAGVQYARWDIVWLRVTLRWASVGLSALFFIVNSLAVLLFYGDMAAENDVIAAYGALYYYNYTLLDWQIVNTWVLPLLAAGMMHGSELDRWLLVGFSALGALGAALNAWHTYTYAYRMPALLYHWVGYILPPALLALAAAGAALIFLLHKKR